MRQTTKRITPRKETNLNNLNAVGTSYKSPRVSLTDSKNTSPTRMKDMTSETMKHKVSNKLSEIKRITSPVRENSIVDHPPMIFGNHSIIAKREASLKKKCSRNFGEKYLKDFSNYKT